MFDAIFFDLDGTLVDTERLAQVSNREAFAALGHEVSEELLHEMIGKDEASVARLISEAYPEIDLEKLGLELITRFKHGLAAGLDLKPGARALLDHLPLPAALVTSSRRDSANVKLRAAKIEGVFARIITADDVTACKPAPEPYLLAAKEFGLDPARCLVFEDSEIGAEAAYRAGCRVVQIQDVLPPSGRWAHIIATDLLDGLTQAGLALAEADSPAE